MTHSTVAAVLLALLPAGGVHQDPPHGQSRGGKEVAAVVPAGGVCGSDEPQIRFVHEGRRVQGVAGCLLGHPGGRQFPQLIVHQRQQLPGGMGVALCKVRQDAGDVIHRLEPP